MEFWHPDIELDDPPNMPDADRYVGVAAVRERIESYLGLGWDGQFHDPEYVDAGEEVVVVWKLAATSPRYGTTMPLEAGTTMAQVYLFEGGKVRRCRQYLSREEGLEAAGRPE